MKQRRCFLRRRGAIPLCAYLLYLLVAASLFTGITASRYLDSDSCDDSAAVAAVALFTSDGGTDPITLTPGGEDIYSFTVSNYEGDTVSEVALKYDVVVTGSLPDGVTMQLDGKNGTASGEEYTFSDAGTLEAGKEDHDQHTLTLTAAADSSSDASAEFTVTIHAEQID